MKIKHVFSIAILFLFYVSPSDTNLFYILNNWTDLYVVIFIPCFHQKNVCCLIFCLMISTKF